MARDIAADTLAVGNALASVRIDQMILNLAKGIAWGQYELDKVGVDITKMMGVPGMVTIGDEKLSMLEAGFLPSFYHFVDTILELKMEVNIREEVNTSLSAKSSTSASTSVETGGEFGVKASASGGFGPFSASVETHAKAHWNTKSTAAYSRSVDASHSQKFSQDLSATSLMRTKLVPVPAPELLVERIKILLERMREEAEQEDRAQIIFTVEYNEDRVKALDGGTADQAVLDALSEWAKTDDKPGTIDKTNVEVFAKGSKWVLSAEIDGKPAQNFLLEAAQRRGEINGYEGAKRKGLEDLLMEKIENRLLDRMKE